MAFNINDFRSNVANKGGLSKSSLFEVVLTLPTGIEGNLSELSLQCESAELPGKTIITADSKIYGPTRKIPYQTQFSDTNLTFLCTNKFTERQIFENWINRITSPSTSNFRYPKDSGYMQTVYVKQFDDSGKLIAECTLLDAFPIGISSQPVNWVDETFHRLTVQFTFYKYQFITY